MFSRCLEGKEGDSVKLQVCFMLVYPPLLAMYWRILSSMPDTSVKHTQEAPSACLLDLLL